MSMAPRCVECDALHGRAHDPECSFSERSADTLENEIGTITAIMFDVHNHLIRAALKGRVSADTRRQLEWKLQDAARHVLKLPLYKD